MMMNKCCLGAEGVRILCGFSRLRCAFRILANGLSPRFYWAARRLKVCGFRRLRCAVFVAEGVRNFPAVSRRPETLRNSLCE